MPLYEYQCKKCKHKFEKIQKFSDRPIKKCPQCGGPVEKVMHAPAVQFKGSGWYVTDYAGKKTGSAVEGGSDKKESSAAKDGSGAKESGGKEKDSSKAEHSKPKKTEAKKTKE